MSNENDSGSADRRTVLKGLGAVAGAGLVGGTGLAAMTGGAAASTMNISGGDPSVSNDRGNLSKLTVDPQFTVNWDNFDDAVGKVFFLLEAKVGGGDFHPIYRATPWLGADAIGTTGSFTRPKSKWGGLGPLVVADSDGLPDYSAMDFPSGDLQSYLDGTSIGSASDYPSNGVVLQNNFPDSDAGYYGAASDTAPFDNANDQMVSEKTTEVTLRYTLELQRPNLSQMKYRVTTMYDGQRVLSGDKGTAWADLSESEKKEESASRIDGLQVSDIDAGNSRIVMSGEDGYVDFGGYADGAGIPYNVLQDNDSHPGILVETATLNVGVTNETSSTNGSGGSNPDAEGSE